MMDIVAFHHEPVIQDSLLRLLGQVWPRSDTARLRSLKQSSDKGPVCHWLLVELEQGIRNVVAHVRLSCLAFSGRNFLVESLIVSECKRGAGLGRFLLSQLQKRLGVKQYSILCEEPLVQYYAKMGFEKTDIEPRYDGQIRIRMRCLSEITVH